MPTPVPEVPPAPVHDPDEDRLITAVVRFANAHVKDVMTPRPDIVALPVVATIGDLTRLMRETKYSRIPVFGENLDDIVGVVTVRDLIEHEGPPSDPRAAAGAARPPGAGDEEDRGAAEGVPGRAASPLRS